MIRNEKVICKKCKGVGNPLNRKTGKRTACQSCKGSGWKQ